MIKSAAGNFQIPSLGIYMHIYVCVCVCVCVCVEWERENGKENDFKKLVHAIVKTRSQKSMERPVDAA